MTEDLAFVPATELASRIRQAELSPVDVVEYFLDRIEDRNPDINAFVTVSDEAARQAARQAERAVANGEELGPLHGVPVAIKDLTDVKGEMTTYGSTMFAENVAEENAPIVDRLKTAGAIIIGKTNTPEFGRKPMTTNYLHGVTGNPWDPTKTAGGSSGGSAAALADGLVPLAQGSDAAGSIRIPSAACGVFGLMPDFGRVPMNSRPDAFVNIYPYTFVGPMARTVEDVALMLDVVAGPASADPYSLAAPERSYTDAIRREIGDLSIAFSPDLGICEVDPRIRDVVEDAVKDVRGLCGTVKRTDPDFPHDWEGLHESIEVLLQDRYWGMYDNFRRDLNLDLLENRDEVTDEVVSRIEKAQELDALDVRRAERIRTDAYDAVQDLLTDHDLLVTPTLGMPPFEKDTKPSEINGEPVDPLHGWALTWPINLTGNPTASIPVGFADGLPVGMQIIGSRLDDATVLAASAALERARPWHRSYPPR